MSTPKRGNPSRKHKLIAKKKINGIGIMWKAQEDIHFFKICLYCYSFLHSLITLVVGWELLGVNRLS